MKTRGFRPHWFILSFMLIFVVGAGVVGAQDDIGTNPDGANPLARTLNSLGFTINTGEQSGGISVAQVTTSQQRYTYVVQPGDNLFRIALNHGTCLSEIARVNNIPASQMRRIYAGQTLIIPDGSTCGAAVNDVSRNNYHPGTVYHPHVDKSTTYPHHLRCDLLRPTSPLGGLAFGEVTFYWDGIPNVGAYRVRLYRNGEIVYATLVEGTLTQVSTSLSSIPAAYEDVYYWDIIAVGEDLSTCYKRSGDMGRHVDD